MTFHNLYKKIIIYSAIFFLPVASVSAQMINEVTTYTNNAKTTQIKDKAFSSLVSDFINVLSGYILQILLALIFVVFLFGLMKYMFKGQGNDSARTEGKKMMFWGIIALFVITTIWSLVAIVASFLGHDYIGIPKF